MAHEGLVRTDGGGIASFLQGEAAFFAAASRDVELFTRGEAPFQAQAIHFPVNLSRGIVLSIRSFHLGNTGDTSRQDAAWRFVLWALEPQQQAAFFWDSALLPSRLSALQAIGPEVEARSPLMLSFVSEVSLYGYPYPSVQAFGQVIAITYEWAQKAIRGEVTAQAAMENIVRLTSAIGR